MCKNTNWQAFSFPEQDVSTARLAQRRKLKNSTDGRSSSSSNFSSVSSGSGNDF